MQHLHWSLFIDNWNVMYFKLLFFQCCHNVKYSRCQSPFVVQSWFDGLFIYLWLRKASHERVNSYLIDGSVFQSSCKLLLTCLIHCLSGPVSSLGGGWLFIVFLTGSLSLWCQAYIEYFMDSVRGRYLRTCCWLISLKGAISAKSENSMIGVVIHLLSSDYTIISIFEFRFWILRFFDSCPIVST